MWQEINGKQVWIDESSKKSRLLQNERFGVKRHYGEDEMGPAPRGAWWAKVLPGVVFLAVVAYFMYKLAMMQPM